MPTVNERLADDTVRHAVSLQRYSNHVVRRMIALLNRTDADLSAQITLALERLPPESFTVERLEQLLGSVHAINARAYQQLGMELTGELRKFAEYEAGYNLSLFQSVIPAQVTAQVAVATVAADQVYAAAMSRPFSGRLLSEFAKSLEADRMIRIRDTIRMGFVESQTISQIVQRVGGTRAKGYSDGIIEIDRRHAESVVRTAISHTAGVARDQFYSANGKIIKALQWSSTLDSRTSEVCRIRDGLEYAPDTHKPIGHKIPWGAGPGRLHWCCRSSSVPITKSWRELGIDMDEFTPTTRASMNGQVPADMTYAGWIKKQPAAVQDDILGETRGALLRRGGLELERFYTEKGRPLSLAEMRERDAAAFAKAGV